MSELRTCAAQVYRRGQYAAWEPCGKPCKGIRTTPDDVMYPVCGIHLRAKFGTVQDRFGRYRALRLKDSQP